MEKSIEVIQQKLIDILKSHLGDLKVTAETDVKFEVCGTITAMQGKKEVDGIYFSSVIPKAKDVRFYLFPCYTHKDELGELPPELKKCMKGKSCFHVKGLDDQLEKQFSQLVKKSIKIYKKDGLL